MGAGVRPGGMQLTRPIAPLVALVLLLAACAPAPGPSGTGVGVRGIVTAGPTCPVVTNPPDPACADRRVAGAVLVFTDAGGREVARVTSAADGAFAVALAPGAYRLSAAPVNGLMGTPAAMDVVVEAGQPMAGLTVSYDTGIR